MSEIKELAINIEPNTEEKKESSIVIGTITFDTIMFNTIRDIMDELSDRVILLEKKVDSLQKENESALENINYLIGRNDKNDK
jgi:hypothetical protein